MKSDMRNYEELLWQIGLLPSLNTTEIEYADTVLKALTDLGLVMVEMSVRNKEFVNMSAAVKRKENCILAASGIQGVADCEKALKCGASLFISHIFQLEVAQWCAKRELSYIPCCTTKEEITCAIDVGVKTFLYSAHVNSEFGKELFAFWQEQGIKFIISDTENYMEFSDKPYVSAVKGDFICPSDITATNDYETIKAYVRGVYLNNLGFELGHVGISTASAEEGHSMTDIISKVFGCRAEHGHVGNWSLGKGIEIVNGKGPGLHGHIAVQCNHVPRAIYYLEKRGHKIKKDTFRFRYPGRLSFAYLEEEFGGFAIHLMLRWTAP